MSKEELDQLLASGTVGDLQIFEKELQNGYNPTVEQVDILFAINSDASRSALGMALYTGYHLSETQAGALFTGQIDENNLCLIQAFENGYQPSKDEIDSLIAQPVTADSFALYAVSIAIKNGYKPTVEQVDTLITFKGDACDSVKIAHENGYIPTTEQVDRWISQDSNYYNIMLQDALKAGYTPTIEQVEQVAAQKYAINDGSTLSEMFEGGINVYAHNGMFVSGKYKDLLDADGNTVQALKVTLGTITFAGRKENVFQKIEESLPNLDRNRKSEKLDPFYDMDLETITAGIGEIRNGDPNVQAPLHATSNFPGASIVQRISQFLDR